MERLNVALHVPWDAESWGRQHVLTEAPDPPLIDVAHAIVKPGLVAGGGDYSLLGCT
jgi:hypothetical protein